jgi:hypothetical protein
MLGSAGGTSDPKSPAIRMLMKDVTKGVKGELPVRGEPVGSASAGGSAPAAPKWRRVYSQWGETAETECMSG